MWYLTQLPAFLIVRINRLISRYALGTRNLSPSYISHDNFAIKKKKKEEEKARDIGGISCVYKNEWISLVA